MSKFNKEVKYNSNLYYCSIQFLKNKTFHTKFNESEDNWECHFDYHMNLYCFSFGDYQTSWFNSSDILDSLNLNIIKQLNQLKEWELSK